MSEMLWIVMALAVLFGPAILAIVALVRLGKVKRQVEALETLFHQLNLGTADIEPADRETETEPASAAASDDIVETATEAPDDVVEDAAQDEPDERPQEPKPSIATWIEEELTSRWLVWLGGLALAISGYFLVVYAAEHGLLGPAARIITGVLLGLALVAGGEWLRRRPLQHVIGSVRPDYIPQALTAGGLATLFASIYAAHGLYDLIGPLTAFALLALVAVAAFALSVLHGAFVAVLGLLAGFVTPALIPSDSPSAFTLFSYLAIVSAACAAVMWYRPWAWLGIGTIAGGAAWTLAWLIGPYGGSDAIVTGGFWIAVFAMHMALAGHTNHATSSPLWEQIPPEHLPDSIAWITALAAACLAALTAFADGFTNTYMTMTMLLAVALVVAALWRQRFDALVILAGLVVLTVFGLWCFRAEVLIELQAFLRAEQGIWAPELSGDVWRLMRWAAITGVAWLYGLYWLMRKAERPYVWAALSVIVPSLLMIGVYYRVFDLLSDRMWAIAGLGLAAAFMAPVAQLRNSGPPDQLKLPLGIYAIGVVAGVSLAMVFLLEEAWLTVALAAQLPAIAWIAEKLDLQVLRRAAFAIAAVCIARLALNPFVFEYASQPVLEDQWVLYAYGFPMVAFHAAFVMFKRQADDLLVSVLEGGRLLFLTLLISAEIRIFVAGSLTGGSFSLLEGGLHASSWLALGWSRWRAYRIDERFINWWAAVILTALACVTVLPVLLIFEGPLLGTVSVGPWPIINSLFVAYLIPSVLLSLIIWQAQNLLHRLARWALAGMCFILGWAWLTFETRHAFQGSTMLPYPGDAENYAYSAVWLAASFAILFAAIYFRKAELRYASLTLIVISVLKVFLHDMADLEGLYRVAAFLGLGLSLVGIGYVYQRFVFLAAPNRGADTTD